MDVFFLQMYARGTEKLYINTIGKTGFSMFTLILASQTRNVFFGTACYAAYC